jgi:alkanesulfonate monooxygenase SsuD/methylene tetrahydromethanopterin reductase-like flavin-dependent oxidoreductase (luciferase family)
LSRRNLRPAPKKSHDLLAIKSSGKRQPWKLTPGVFALTDLMTARQLTSFARNLEKHGYGSLWFPEALGRDPFAVATRILTVTKKLIVGTGIANV